MNTYPHEIHRLAHNGFKGLDRIDRARLRNRNMERLGCALFWLFVVLCLIAAWPAHAEPTNAPDVRGNFVLVVGGSWHYSQPLGTYNAAGTETSLIQIQPFTVPGFKSYHLCRGAGEELQARFNTDGYTLDFVCLAVSK